MTATLSAWRIPHYGAPDILTPVTLPMPEPGQTEVLIRIRASAVTRADGLMRRGEPLFARPFLGLRRPRAGLSGTGLSGEVIAVGDKVSRFAPGDMVFGEAGMHFGANATHICLDETGVLMPKPENLSHEDAAVLCDGVLTSWHYLHNLGQVKSGDRVLILGGAGSLGSAAVQIAAAMGAEVTATSSARNEALVAALGASRVIDYTREAAMQPGAAYDVIFDTVGVASFSVAKPALAEAGRYLCPVLKLGRLPAILLSSVMGRKRALFAATGLEKPERLRAMLSEILDLIAQDRLAPVMDRIYPLADLVEAHAYVEGGHKRGNVVVV
ncbi:NADPH:quinone reductase [Roseivivax lentus]|uniref:NADPH:quinone reductase n=1 Tax=Roseivivax lentus TaxID=633194 RepID=A0A1N7M027_9RHOB|nr:NAD(P)-dependent alcohol dehydrogenase [Roseivivax lentus]SIS79450.1 NADPH:quinone reductase [Roseivivax lentus]